MICLTIIVALILPAWTSDGKSIYEIFGQIGCFLFRFSFLVHFATGYLASLSMAYFRYGILRINLNNSPKKFFTNLLMFELFFGSIWCTLKLFAYQMTGHNSVVDSFCHDSSRLVLLTVQKHSTDYSEKLESIGNTLNMVLILTRVACIFFEAFIYYSIYKNASQSNAKMRNNVSKKVFNKRRQKNIQTLSGQMSIFFCKTVVSLLIFVLLLIPDLDLAKRFAVSTIGIFPGIFTLLTMWSSPEVMKHYFNIYN